MFGKDHLHTTAIWFLLAAFCTPVIAQQPPRIRPLAPGVLTVIPPETEAEETFSGPVPIVEITQGIPNLTWIPNFDAKSNTLEAAAAKSGLTVDETNTFTRTSFVEGLGFSNEAVGAAFGAPLGEPLLVKVLDAVYVMRVERRVEASRADFDAQKESLRRQRMNDAREERIRIWLDDLRKEAKVDDRRREVNASLRRMVVE